MSFVISPFPRAQIVNFHSAVKPTYDVGTFESYIYLITEKAASGVWRKGIVDYVSFSYDTDDTSAGAFEFVNNPDFTEETFIKLNFANIKTYRDLVFSFLHEWGHALQYDSMGSQLFSDDMLEGFTMNDQAYLHHELEVDADQFAFENETPMRYKNFPINPNVTTSVFVTRKRARAC